MCVCTRACVSLCVCVSACVCMCMCVMLVSLFGFMRFELLVVVFIISPYAQCLIVGV